MLLVDTGPLLATADRNDADHQACRALLEKDAGPLVTSALVIAEASYLLDRELGPIADAALFRSIVDGDLRVEPLRLADWTRIAELVEEYSDLRLGGQALRSSLSVNASGLHGSPR
ncbi:MAG: type II toxin-antitoxin system VapC family toxin [Acidimicrobiales bacterium]